MSLSFGKHVLSNIVFSWLLPLGKILVKYTQCSGKERNALQLFSTFFFIRNENFIKRRKIITTHRERDKMSQKQSKETKQQTNPRLQQSKPYPNCNVYKEISLSYNKNLQRIAKSERDKCLNSLCFLTQITTQYRILSTNYIQNHKHH